MHTLHRILAIAPLALSAIAYAAPALSTVAEQTQWTKTGRYDEVIRLCHAFEKSYPGRAKCIKFGRTPEERDMLAIVASEARALTPAQAKARHLPVVLAQGAIHAGEVDGKDAGLYLLREMLDHKSLPGALKKLTFVFVPVFNVDGHERFGAHNRPNQRGPEQMGWRVTAQNLNLNRDYVKAEAPEMRAMLGLLNRWDPILYIDLHVTDGADFQHEIAVRVDPNLKGPEALHAKAQKLDQDIMRELAAKKHLPLDYYPEFRTEDDPASGFELEIPPPRFSDAYWGVRNRIGVLVETHSWKTYAVRVRATIDALHSMLEATAKDGAGWLEAAKQADADALKLADHDVTLTYEANQSKSTPVEFLGYAYKREPSDISGALMTSYDPTQPKTFHLPLFDQLEPKLTVHAPKQGYYVPAPQAAQVEPWLKAHGISYKALAKANAERAMQEYRCPDPTFKPKSNEGHQELECKGTWVASRHALPPGSLFVPIAQTRARLVLHIFEPEAPDSLVSWGAFNAMFERKEYMEPYVAEQVAREMLKDPAVKAESDKKVSEDKAFAKDPDQRLEFFYRRHPSWDQRYGLYPIYKY
jgi:hypothetical protein